MKAILRTFKAGKGDCVTFQINDEVNTYNMLIDCGALTPLIKNLIENEWHQHIHHLVVTHFDNDHLDGLIEMLNLYPNLIIDKIWFNCGQKVQGDLKPLNDNKQKVIKRLRNQLPTKVNPSTHKINAESSLTLAELLLSKQSWADAWSKDEYITNNTANLVLPHNMGSLILLSPNEEAIEKLNKKYIEAFNEIFYTKYDGPYESGETIYELLMRLTAEKREESLHDVNSDALSLEFIKDNTFDHTVSISDANKASIVFMWEKENHRVLLLADADPRVVTKNLKLKANYETPQKIDAIKISHHGSKHNTLKDLYDIVDAEHYFFTGGDETKCRPSHESIKTIINLSNDSGVEKRILHFNYLNSIAEKYININEQIKNEMHFNAINNEECRHEINIQ